MLIMCRRRFVESNKNIYRIVEKERHMEHIGKNNEQKNKIKYVAAIIYIHTKLSGMDLIEHSAYIHIKIRYLNVRLKMRQWDDTNNEFYIDRIK